jgi:MFS family permease
MSALFTGLMHMPYGLGTMLGIGVMSRAFLPRFGRWVLVAGTGVMLIAGAGALYGTAPGHWPWAAVGALLVLTGAGMGATVGCIGPIVVSEVDRATTARPAR